ncbi:MAG TPA: (2Fe-2S)-binding protein [Longimicrobiales bacterium]
MSGVIELIVDGRTIECDATISVAAALLNAGVTTFRRSATGAERGPLCGMGICFECRVTIDGTPHQRACMRVVRHGMTVMTNA